MAPKKSTFLIYIDNLYLVRDIFALFFSAAASMSPMTPISFPHARDDCTYNVRHICNMVHHSSVQVLFTLCEGIKKNRCAASETPSYSVQTAVVTDTAS